MKFFLSSSIWNKENVKSKFFPYLIFSFILFILFFFLVLPVSNIVAKAVYDSSGFSFKYLKLLLANDLYTQGIINSLMIGLLTTFLAVLVSLPLAMLNSKFNYKGKGVLSALLLVPMVMPPFVGAIGIQRFFARFGSINIFLLDYNIISRPIDWLNPDYNLWIVSIISALHLYPILYLNLAAAIANVDPSLEEAAASLGSSRFQRFKDIMIPLITPGFFSGSIIIFIWSFTDLGTPLLVGFHETVPVYIFNLITNIDDNPVGYALVLSVIIITSSIFLLSKLAFSKKKYEMLGKGHSVTDVSNAGFKQSFLIYSLSLLVIFLALIPHITVAITSLSHNWFMTSLPEKLTMSHYATIFSNNLSLTGLQNSLFLSTTATLLNIVLGLTISYIVTRKLIPFGNFLDSLVMVPLALPGVVLAFGYVITYTGTWLDPLSNPIPLLIIAYSIRRLPFMVRAATAGLQQTSQSLEEASLLFGASKLKTLFKITIPLLMANLIAGSLMCFSYAMLDVSDSLILAMKDEYYPLTKAIYAFYLEQGNGEFVASALGMFAMFVLSISIFSAAKALGQRMGELFKA